MYAPDPIGSVWLYEYMRNKTKILFYSGDIDGSVNMEGSRKWIERLGWNVTEPWRNWKVNGAGSGYIERFDGLDFATVHGAGHMVPCDKPE